MFVPSRFHASSLSRLLGFLTSALLFGGLNPARADQTPRSSDAKKAEAREHWAFKLPAHSVPPNIKSQSWIRTPVDNFILSKLEQNKLTPSPEADRPTLIRRLSFDLIGLPPTPAEVEAFVADGSS